MNYAQIREIDIVNGTGIRTSLFVSGCHFHCMGCFNKSFQEFTYGNEWNDTIQNKFIQLGSKDFIEGYSILGGEPLDQDDSILTLVKEIKEYTRKSIWLWSGYRFEDLNQKQLEIIKYIDVMIDGQFIEQLKNLNLKFRGSSNQRIIDVKKSLSNNEVVLLDI